MRRIVAGTEPTQTALMDAIVQEAYGPPDALRLRRMDRPTIGEDEVLVRVQAAGIDPSIWHLVAGSPYLVRLMGYGLRAPKQPVPGTDLAGRVEAVGAAVTSFRPGDQVFGAGAGALAGYARAREDHLVHKPAALSFEQAAAIPVSATTALQALRDKGRIQAGQHVLVIGAGGGVGTFAIQLAKAFGAEVTGVCSGRKADLVRALGADHTIDYTRVDPLEGRRRHDLIIDTAGNRSISALRRALTPTGTLVIVGGEGGGRWLGGTDRLLRAAVVSPFVGQRLLGLFATHRREDLLHLADLVEAGELTPVVDRTFPLREAVEAITFVRRGDARGKVVVTV